MWVSVRSWIAILISNAGWFHSKDVIIAMKIMYNNFDLVGGSFEVA